MTSIAYNSPLNPLKRPTAQPMPGEAPHPVPGVPGQPTAQPAQPIRPPGVPGEAPHPVPPLPGAPPIQQNRPQIGTRVDPYAGTPYAGTGGPYIPQGQTAAATNAQPANVPLAGNVPTTGPNPSAVTPLPPIADPNTSLRNNVYTPGNDPRLTASQGATDAAGSAIQNGPSFSQMAQGNEARYRSVFGDGQVQSLNDPTAPNRTQLAKTALADYDTQDLENRQKQYRSLTQNAAAGGRLGMMDEARKVLDTERLFNQDRMRFSNELARDVSEGDISDRFRRVEFDTGVNERNADRLFDRARAGADYGGRDAESDLNDRYSRYDAAGSLEDRVYGQGQSNRGEYRTERGRQDTLAQQTLDNRLRQRQQEEAEREARIRQAALQAQYGGG